MKKCNKDSKIQGIILVKKPYKYEAERKEAKRLIRSIPITNPYAFVYGTALSEASECALITVNNIIRSMVAIPNIPKENIRFWKRVKKEIEKLKA